MLSCRSIIGEERILSIRVGSQATVGLDVAPLGQNDIQIRGPSSEVDRAIREIRHIEAKAKKDEIDNGYVGPWLFELIKRGKLMRYMPLDPRI